jgi:AraC-like DNA-binding protein
MRAPTNHLPAIELRDYILSYGILDIPEGAEEPYFSPPIGLSGFIIHTINQQNSIAAKIENRAHYTEEAVATGQVTRPVHGTNIGRARILMVFFHPLGMHQLFGTNMASLTNTSMPLPKFLGVDEANELTRNLRANQDDLRQVRVLNEFFSARSPKAQENAARIRNVLEHIHLRKGDVSVRELEGYGHYERKTLERHFMRMVGISPKMYSKIYRFRCLMNLLQSRPEMTWTDLTDQAGFYDQSHMSRYVRDYLGVSPGSIVRLDMRLINYLLTL